MAGAHINAKLEDREVAEALARTRRELGSPARLLRVIGEYLQRSTQRRFTNTSDALRATWAALSPRYLARKPKNRDKVLVLSGDLRELIRYQVTDDAVLVGSDRPYAAHQQFGGPVTMQVRAHTRTMRFIQSRARGGLRQQSEVRRVQVKAHTRVSKLAARPFLGVTDDDRREILAETRAFIARLWG